MDQARRQDPPIAFDRLRREIQELAARPTGVGLDVPEWLRQLENEAHRVRRTHATIAVLAGDMFRLPQRTLSREAVEQQFEGGEAPLG